ncbi:hypothetical protein PFISCL1PPCAC_19065, partial [Pristionchus fissidentatus]
VASFLAVFANEKLNLSRLRMSYPKRSWSFTESTISTIFIEESKRIEMDVQKHFDYCFAEAKKFEISEEEQKHGKMYDIRSISTNFNTSEELIDHVRSEAPHTYDIFLKRFNMVNKLIEKTSNESLQFVKDVAYIVVQGYVDFTRENAKTEETVIRVLGPVIKKVKSLYSSLSEASRNELESTICLQSATRLFVTIKDVERTLNLVEEQD